MIIQLLQSFPELKLELVSIIYFSNNVWLDLGLHTVIGYQHTTSVIQSQERPVRSHWLQGRRKLRGCVIIYLASKSTLKTFLKTTFKTNKQNQTKKNPHFYEMKYTSRNNFFKAHCSSYARWDNNKNILVSFLLKWFAFIWWTRTHQSPLPTTPAVFFFFCCFVFSFNN